MSKYQKKYQKYKIKYISLKNSLSRTKMDINIDEARDSNNSHKPSYKYISRRKIGRLLGRNIKINEVNLKNLDIPKEYPIGSPLINAATSFGQDKEFNINTQKFKPNNSKLELSQDDLNEGRFKFVTNDGTNYYLRAIPFLFINTTNKSLCFPWVNSFYMNIPYLEDKIIELRDKFLEFYSKDIKYLNFDCVNNFGEHPNSGLLYADILILMRYILDGQGYFMMTFPKMENKNFEHLEYLMITSIKKADEPEIIG